MIRLWKLGDLENKILPTNEAFQKLADILNTDKDGEVLDLIWGPDLTVELIPTGPQDIEALKALDIVVTNTKD